MTDNLRRFLTEFERKEVTNNACRNSVRLEGFWQSIAFNPSKYSTPECTRYTEKYILN